MLSRLSLVIAATSLLVGCTAHEKVRVVESATVGVQAASHEAIRGIHNVGITVSDIDETLAFYGAAVPYELVERRRIPAATFPAELLAKRDGEVEIAFIRTPTVFLRLLDIDPDNAAEPNRRPVIGPGYTHICFQSHAAAPKYDRFKELGLDMVSRGDRPVDLGGYGVTYAYGYDPDGIMIEMEQLETRAIAASGELGRKKIGHTAWISHVANVTGDKPAMVEFYSTILGYGPKREIPPTKRQTFDDIADMDDIEIAASWFDVGNLQIELWHYTKPKTPVHDQPRMLDEIGYSSVVFEVIDLAGTAARLESEGMVFAGQSFELGGRMIRFARDPEGNLIAFQERLGGSDPYSIESVRWFAETRSPTGPKVD
ncbi:VOC family protein [Pontixanthobacter sp. CEM42]|uniref:VOC family protein n=1 Tax=Pontixanthobacter sp. CEM42 TaxID=2792077 RepID=UPI001ADF5225|nr:VOC family protein [Pontixanthobacter sp. CEM42]